jgi:flagellar assembly protein FliH
MSGPVVSFRGKRPDATEVEHEAQRATREGFARGHSDGLAAAAEEINQLRRRLQQQCSTVERLLQQMAKPLERLDAGATQELVHLAVRIGAQLAARELRAHPEQILELAQQAVQALPSTTREIDLLLNPHDFAVLQSAMTRSSDAAGWRLLADPHVARGGCRILMGSSQIDADFDARLAALLETLFAEESPMPQRDVTAELAAEQGEL